jgi:two-component system, NarL family, nitrate/nitrite response regulator NarL
MASSAQSGHTETARRVDLLIAERSPMDCELVKSGLTGSRSPFRVVACAVSHAEIIRDMKSHSPDIALISESLEDGPLTGFGVLNELHNSFPKTSVIVLLKSASEDLAVDAFRAGARGVFCRTEPLHALYKCINAVHEGQIWANGSQLRAVLDAFVSAAPLHLVYSQGRRALLTKRENDVVKLVVDGYTNRDVAQKSGLTEHTVSNYLFRIYQKLGISSRVELVLSSLKRPELTHSPAVGLLPREQRLTRIPITTRTNS